MIAMRSRNRQLLVAVLGALALLTVASELFAKLYLGLGDPPLVMSDPGIEYLFQPSRCYHRFGNEVCYNSYSLRSDEFAKTKTHPEERRVIFLGDSVLNGGALTDQQDLATSLLGKWLQQDLSGPLVTGNVSAGSRGPPNFLAYARRHGFFDADLVVLVLSSHDAADVPTGENLVGADPDFPDHSPTLALQEMVSR